jgi:high-affinity nickel-transport protein
VFAGLPLFHRAKLPAMSIGSSHGQDCSEPLLAAEVVKGAGCSPLRSEAVRGGFRLMSGILVVTAISLGSAMFYSRTYPVILSHALLAFVLGLRHAVDCDHLASIDNVTRQLLRRGQPATSVGFWFAIGHSTIVFLMTGALAGGYSLASRVGGQVTTSLALVAAILAVLLLAGIGLLNARVSVEIYKEWSGMRAMSEDDQEKASRDSAEDALRTAFTVIPFVQRAFECVDRASKMYYVGFLFGLSFDTASQVGLIGMTAVTGSHGNAPLWMVMIFPMCFSCGMCLVDSGNGLLMIAAYGRANVQPAEKLLYNLLVTAMSACIALMIGSLESLQIISQQADLKGPFWDWIQKVDMGVIGYMIISAFLVIFTVASLYSFIEKKMTRKSDDDQGLRVSP